MNTQFYSCANCSFTADEDSFPQAQSLSMRLAPGDIYTDKECPKCGALSYLVTELQGDKYLCTQCGGTDVEICLPAHFKLNHLTGLKLVSIDEEAEALTYYCPDCSEDVEVWDPVSERTTTGRWLR